MGTPQNLLALLAQMGRWVFVWQTSSFHLAYLTLVLLSKQHGTIVTAINHKYLGLHWIGHR